MMVLLDRLRRAVNKLSFLLKLKNYLAFTQSSLGLASLLGSKAPGSITGRRWGRRAISFNDRPGLRVCVTDGDHDHLEDHSPRSKNQQHDHDSEGYDVGSESSSMGNSPRTLLRRTTSYPLEEDVDRQADMFIDNFYKHLIFEKQVSLNLRYCRDSSSSFDYSSGDSLVSPFSTTSSHLVSPT